MTRTLLVLNGPHLGRLGTRQPEVYGTTTYAELVDLCQAEAAVAGWVADVRQTEDEAELLGWLHEATDARTPVVLNPGAWGHYSYALRDGVSLVAEVADVIEVHLSQTAAREEFRHASVVSAVVRGTVTGLGVEGYRAAIRAVVARH